MILLVCIDSILFQVLIGVGPRDFAGYFEARADKKLFEAEILISGCSLTADGLGPHLLEEATGKATFNYGVYHQSPLEAYYIITDIVSRHDNKIKTVIYGTNPVMFQRENIVTEFAYILTPSIVGKAHLALTYMRKEPIYRLFKSNACRLPLKTYFAHLLFGKSYERAERDIEGFDSGYLVNTNCGGCKFVIAGNDSVFDDYITRYKKQRSGFPINNTQVYYFEKLVKFLRDRKINLLLVNLPSQIPFYLFETQQPNYKRFHDVFNVIVSRYGLPFFDGYKRAYLDGFSCNDFLDTQHLCNRGAVKYSHDVAEWLKHTM